MRAQSVVNEQALDDGLWFEARTAPEAYLQAALRRLHQAVEMETARRMGGMVGGKEIRDTFTFKGAAKEEPRG